MVGYKPTLQQSEALELSFELRKAVDLESLHPDIPCRLNVDRRVVEEGDPSRWHIQIADDVFEDLLFRLHQTQLVGKVIPFQERLDAPPVKWRVKLVRVAQAGKTYRVLEPLEERPRPG